MTNYYFGIRILMLIHRKKDGGSNRGDRDSVRRISYDSSMFTEKVMELDEIGKKSGCPYRIYSSLNPRNFEKAERLFRKQQIDLETQSIEKKIDFYLQSRNQILSCLAKPECKDANLMLIDVDFDIDCDKKDVIKKLVNRLVEKDVKILDFRDTPNGLHIIVQPFNPNLFPELEVKKDGMILLHWSNLK